MNNASTWPRLSSVLVGLLVLPLTDAALSAEAENWVRIGHSATSVMYADKGTGEVTDGHVRYWDKIVFASSHRIGVYESQKITGANFKGLTDFVEMRGYHDVDCRNNTFITTLTKFYDAAGNVVSVIEPPSDSKNIQPNSLIYLGAKLMCPAR